MAPSKVLLVAVVALLAGCATCVQDATAIQRVQGGSGSSDSLSEGFSARDLLRKKRKRVKKTTKRNVRKAKSEATNTNVEGVLVNQQGSVRAEGDGNLVLTGATSPIFNAVIDTGDIDARRKLRTVEESSVDRDLLRKKRRVKKTKKIRRRKAKSEATNINGEGVLINQQTTANIDGDGNLVVGGATAPITNVNLDTGDIDLRRKLKSIEGSSVDRDLLRKRKRVKKTKKIRRRNAKSEAVNANDEGVLINQQTTANIKGDGNGVLGGATAPIFNANLDVGDIDFDRRKLKSIEGSSVDRDLLRKKRKRVKKTKKIRRREANSEAQNANDEGVLINQQTTANIDGDGNGVLGGATAPIFNANLDIGDIDFDRRKLKSIEGSSVDRDLLRKKRKRVKKTKKIRRREANSEAENVNGEGVLVNQQTTANIKGDGNGVVGGATAPIFNANLDFGDIDIDR